MKLVKMSLAAAVLLGTSAFALDNVKVSGDAKLYYGTTDAGSNNLLNKGTLLNAPDQGVSFADTAVRVGVTADLAKGISAGVTAYAVSTLGLENNLVSNVWTTAHNNVVGDSGWIGEAWIAGTLGKTTAKIGRMELDTPLAFSEKWNIVPNTFEAGVLVNQDIPDTTLVGAWVGRSNSSGGFGVVAPGGQFSTFGAEGAYAAAIVNNSIKPLTLQAWYYDIVRAAQAYWLQADWDCQLVKNLKLGGQFAEVSAVSGAKDSKAWAVKGAYTASALNVSAAYSEADKNGASGPIQNTAGTESKLYTEAYWNYGYVGQAGAKAFNIAANYDAGIAKLGAQYTDISNNTTNVDMTGVAVTATKSFGAVDGTLAYVSTEADNLNAGKQFNTVLAMLKLNF